MILDREELARRNIPEPIVEHQFCDDRKWRFDYAWPEHKLALEFDGNLWHRSRHNYRKGLMGDMVKFNEAALLGWKVIHIPSNVHKLPFKQGGDLAYHYLQRFFTAPGRASQESTPEACCRLPSPSVPPR